MSTVVYWNARAMVVTVDVVVYGVVGHSLYEPARYGATERDSPLLQVQMSETM